QEGEGSVFRHQRLFVLQNSVAPTCYGTAYRQARSYPVPVSRRDLPTCGTGDVRGRRSSPAVGLSAAPTLAAGVRVRRSGWCPHARSSAVPLLRVPADLRQLRRLGHLGRDLILTGDVF